MKVLFITYPRIGLGHGGFEIQIEKTCQELRHIGVEVLLYDPWKNQWSKGEWIKGKIQLPDFKRSILIRIEKD